MASVVCYALFPMGLLGTCRTDYQDMRYAIMHHPPEVLAAFEKAAAGDAEKVKT